MFEISSVTVKILKFGTPQTIAIIVLKIEKFDVTLHWCIQKMLMEWQTAYTLIRLLVQKQSDLGLHCLLRHIRPNT